MKLPPDTSRSETDRSTYSIRAAERVCDVLDLAQRKPDGFWFADVVETTGLPKSSAFRYLSTLQARRYVDRDEDTGMFHIGPALQPGGKRDLLTQVARPFLEQLRDTFEETINLSILDGNRVVYLAVVDSPKSVRLSAREGDRDPIHCTAVGKAIATRLPPSQVRTILETEGMESRTPATITDIDRYFQELGATASRGFALDNGENEEDGRCVAVAFDCFNWPAAISLSAPSARFTLTEVDEVAAALSRVTARLRQVVGEDD